jgi:transketolase C-terminal domain/subunit
METFIPCGSEDVLNNLDYLLETKNSVYVRLSKYGKNNLEQYFVYKQSKILFRNFGKFQNQICIISTGPISYNVYNAISNSDLNVLHIHMPFLKYINHDDLISLCQTASKILIFEEHSVIGGLFSLCSEIFTSSTLLKHVPVYNYGVEDTFIHKYGIQEEIWEHLSIDTNSIKNIIVNI